MSPHSALRTPHFALLIVFLLALCSNVCAQLSPPPIEFLTPGLESNRFNLGILHNLKDDYSDFTGSNSSVNLTLDCEGAGGSVPGNASTHFDINSNFQLLLAPSLHNMIGLNNIYRHSARSDEFVRSPFCQNESGSYQEDYYNHALLANDGDCNDITFSGNDHLTNMIGSALNQNMQFGIYRKSGTDFFYETEHETYEGSYSGNDDNECFCRSDGGGNSATNTYYDIPPAFTTATVGSNNSQNTIPSTLNSNGCPFSHFMCVNCENWRNISLNRLRVLGEHRPSFLLFDEWFMPDSYRYRTSSKLLEGCWCVNCRERYCAALGENNILCRNMYFRFNDDSNVWRRRKNMINLLDASANDFIKATRGVLKSYGVTYIQSVGGLTKMNDDNVRSSILRNMDAVKTEWSIPTRSVNNTIFWGSLPDVNNLDAYYSILNNYRIPTHLRQQVAFSMARDGSRSRSIFIWTPPGPFDNGCAVDNLLMLHTYGFATQLGAHHSTSSQRPLKTTLDTSPSVNVTVDGIADNIRFLSNNQGLPASNTNADCENNIRLFDYDAFVSSHLRFLRPTSWAGVYFSETERNKYLHLETNPDAATEEMLTSIAGGTGGTFPVSFKEAQREALAWLQHLLPVHAGLQSISNSRVVGQDVSLKLPVTVVNDYLLREKYVLQNKGIIVPLPLDVPPFVLDASLNSPELQTLEEETRSYLQIAASLTNPVSMLAIGNNSFQWFSNTPSTDLVAAQDQIRQTAIDAFGLPPIYVSGHDAAAHQVEAGFFTDPLSPQTRPYASVVLSNSPAWGLIEAWFNSDNPDSSLPPELSAAQSIAMPLLVAADMIRVRIPFNSLLLTNTLPLLPCAHAVAIDGDTFSTGIALSQVTTTDNLLNAPNIGEYVFSVPQFQHHCVVKINFGCQN